MFDDVSSSVAQLLHSVVFLATTSQKGGKHKCYIKEPHQDFNIIMGFQHNYVTFSDQQAKTHKHNLEITHSHHFSLQEG